MVIISSAIANNLSSISELTYKQYSDYYDKTYGENIDINKIDINECYELDDGVPVLGDIPVATGGLVQHRYITFFQVTVHCFWINGFCFCIVHVFTNMFTNGC